MMQLITQLNRAFLAAAVVLLAGVPVLAQCTFTPAITPTNLVLCPNGTDTLWTGAYDSYQWNMEGNPIPGATQQYFPVDYFSHAGASFTVTVTLEGCTETSASVLVDGYVFLLPFVATHGSDQLCPGDTVILELMSPYETNIQWFKDGGELSGATDDSLIITQPGAYTVQGAPAVCPGYIAPLGLDVIINGPVAPQITPAAVTLCNGSADTLMIPAYDSHQWYLDDQPLSGETSNMLIIQAGGNYYATAQSGGCLLYSDTVAVENYLTGTITISLTTDGLMATISHPGISSFQWYRNGVPVPGATAQTYQPTLAGSYTVTGMDNGCTVSAQPFDYEPTSVERNIRQEHLRVHPNPTTSRLTIESTQSLWLTVYDMTGRELLQGAAPGRLELGHLPAGLYLLRATDQEGRVVAKQMVQKQ